jgi:hypothetical protein
MKHRRWLAALLALLLLLLLGSAALAQSGLPSIDFWTVDGGGGTSGDGTYTLTGTIGQPEAGRLTNGTYTIKGGFWSLSGSIPAAVTLAGFTAHPREGYILLQWETVSEQHNAGFRLYRGTDPQGAGVLLTDTLIASEAPGSSEGYSYEWVDQQVQVGTTYYYWLEAVDVSGAASRFGPVTASIQSPTSITLGSLHTSPTAAPLWLLAALALTTIGGTLLLRRR